MGEGFIQKAFTFRGVGDGLPIGPLCQQETGENGQSAVTEHGSWKGEG